MSQVSGTAATYSPQKASNGQYVYSKDKRVNHVLNKVGASDSRVVQNLSQVQGFSQVGGTNLTTGVFSSPQTTPGQLSFQEIQQLTEEEL